MPTYGGDEVSAVVLDIGTNTTRAGYAGEDTPKVVIPTAYGYIPSSSASSSSNTTPKVDHDQDQYFFGDHGPTVWRAKMEVLHPLRDSIVQDWTATEKLMKVVFDREMRLGLPSAELESDEKRGILTEHPLLVTEPSWSPKENRERMIELAFEEFDAPAYYSVDRAVMCAFASGKGSALVVDIGDDVTTVTPICDGFVLRKGIQKSPIAGNLISQLFLSTTENEFSTPVYPHYLIASRPTSSPPPSNHDALASAKNDADTVMASADALPLPAGVTLREERLPRREDSLTTESFAKFQKFRVMHDLKETVCEVFPRQWDDEAVNSTSGRSFEFPAGHSLQYERQRYVIPEVFFNPSLIPPGFQYTRPGSEHGAGVNSTIATPELGPSTLSLAKMIMKSVNSCDVDVQTILNSNIIVSGGSSLMPGLMERLEVELKVALPGMKFKIFGSGNICERRFGAWLGGSVLASLGSFHQLWVGKDEYKEQGRTVVHRRCR